MNRLRELLARSPWLGWAVAGLILVAAVFIYMRRSGMNDPYDPRRLSQMMSIRYSDTGEVVEMRRADVELELRRRAGRLDPGAGLINPKTGQATGFPYSKGDWDKTIERLNAEKQEAVKRRGKTLAEPTVKAPPASVMQQGEGQPESK